MVIGHQRVIQYLEKVLEKGSWAHGYLFWGPEHVGKTTVADAFVRALFCDRGLRKLGGCGTCANCTAPDLRLSNRLFRLAPQEVTEEKNQTSEISIKEVRELHHWLSFASEAPRVVLIESADVMSEEAANALLKMLEEPHPTTVFLLISSAPQYILPTIRSRAVPLRFGLVPDSILAKVKSATEELVHIAGGRPEILVRAILDPVFRKEEEKMRRAAERIWRGGISDAASAAKEFSDSLGLEKKITLHLLSFARKEAAVLDNTALASLIRRVSRAIQALSQSQTTNVNRRLALDIIFLNLQRVRPSQA